MFQSLCCFCYLGQEAQQYRHRSEISYLNYQSDSVASRFSTLTGKRKETMHYVLKLQQGRTLSLKWKPPPGHGCPLCYFSRARVRKVGSRDRWLAPHANSATYQCGHLEGITPTPGLSFFSCKRGTARRKQATADLSTLKAPGFLAFNYFVLSQYLWHGLRRRVSSTIYIDHSKASNRLAL